MPVDRFLCPHCKAILNPGTKVVLRVSHSAQTGLVLLAATLGDYEVILAPGFPITEGDEADFSCPVCLAELTSPAHPAFIEILRERLDGGHDRVEFHRTYGRHATFVVTLDEQIEAFGEHAAANSPMNFFGVGGSGE